MKFDGDADNSFPPSAPIKKRPTCNIARGFAWGIGFYLAQRFMGCLMGPPSTESTRYEACSDYSKEFQRCLEINVNDISKCQEYMARLAACKKKCK